MTGAPSLTAVIGGKGLRKFSVNGGERLDLGKINQDELELHLNGHGSVTGSGHVNKLDLTIAGSGKAALDRLSVGDADVRIFGSGKGVIAPHGKLNLFVTGSGQIALASKPTEIDQNVLGSGGTCPTPPTQTQSCLIDDVLAVTKVKTGYTFTYQTVAGTGPNVGYAIEGNPTALNQSGVRSFCSFADAVIRFQASGGGLVTCPSATPPLQ